MADAKFKVGDVVTITSNDHKMTIEEQLTYYSQQQTKDVFSGKYKCVWFLNGEYMRGEFFEETLKLA